MWSTGSWLLFLGGCPTPSEPACVDTPGAICTVVGTGDQGFNADGLDPLESWLYLPTVVRWDDEGRLLVDDYNNNRIRRLEADGTLRTAVGSGVHAYSVPGDGPLQTPLENPIDFSFGPDGAMYLSGSHECRILRIEEGGVVEVYAGTGDEGDSGDDGPAAEATFSAELGGMAFGDDGSLYVADTVFGTLRRITPDGLVTLVADGLSRPQGVAWQGGMVYVAEAGGGRVLGVEPETGDLAPIIDGLDMPFGVAADGDALLVADAGAGTILRWDGDTEVVAGGGTDAGEGVPAIDAKLDTPSSAERGPDGAIHVVEYGGARVRRITPE